MITKRQRLNAERIVELADAFGDLPFNEHGQTTEQVLNLSIPTARLILANIVTGVADTNDGVNDNAVLDVQEHAEEAVALAVATHGDGWWNDERHRDLLSRKRWEQRAEVGGTTREAQHLAVPRQYGIS